jgi:serine/threonine protein kinase
MKTQSSTSEDELAELLDAALREARSVPRFDLAEWRRSHPPRNDEEGTLIEILMELSRSVEVWRRDEVETGPDDEQTADAETVLPRVALGSIGRYKLLRHVGSGSMGDVYLAWDPQLERNVAVKVPRCDRMMRNQAMFTQRFIREAKSAAAVRHPHICPIYDFGDSDGQPWVVMAFVEGESLDSVLARGRIEDIRKAVQIAIQVADALSAIHQQGIIHRDLKPGNILIDKDGQALLTDFGLALSEMNAERITSDGLIIGTPVYMAPEQAAGENSSLTPAADLYSLGAVLYEMLTGQAPFRAPLPELLRKIMLQTPVSADEVRQDIDPALSAILDKALAKHPEDRYASAAAFAESLREWVGSIASGVTSPQRTAATSLRSVDALKRINTGARAIGAVAVLSVIVFAVLYFRNWGGGEHGSRPTVSATSSKSDNDHRNFIKPSPASAVPLELSGKLNITVSSNPEQGLVTKTRLPATDPGALPVQTGELVRFEVQLNQPAYAYLLWVSPDGTVAPVYPWDSEHVPGWRAPFVAGSERANDHILCPVSPTRGFEVGEPMGLQTVVLLARREPLDQNIDLAQVLANLPATPALTLNSKPGPIVRGLKTGETKSIEDPQFDELKTRLSPHFEFMRVMSFPQIAAADGGDVNQDDSPNQRETSPDPDVKNPGSEKSI